MGKCGTSASVNHSRRKAMKKIILSLLAAGLSGTALLHAAEPVKLDQPDLERGGANYESPVRPPIHPELF